MVRGLHQALVVVLATTTFACSSPSSSQPAEALEAAKRATTNRLEEIQKELEGLGPQERRAALIEMAVEEGGVVEAYGTMNLDEAGPIIDAFEDTTELVVNYYRASSEDLVQRLVEEAKADFQGADIVFTNGPEMTLLDDEGLLAPVDTPASDAILEEGISDTWVWWYLNTFIPAWNTDLVTPEKAPSSWEDVLTDFPGELALQADDLDWFATLVKDYFVAEKGMSEEAAIDLFRQAAAGATIVDGHTLMSELLAAGEFSVAASPYLHRVSQLKEEGAPLDWEPAVEPLVVRPNGGGVHAAAKHPAAGLLFMEYLLTDAQDMLLQFDRQPASTAVEGGGLPRGYEDIVMDVDAVVNEFDKWSDLYEEVIQESEGKIVED